MRLGDPPLYGDESYQGPPADDFESSRAAAVVSFAQGLGVASTSADGPKDFSFLLSSSARKSPSPVRVRGGSRSRSRSPTPHTVRRLARSAAVTQSEAPQQNQRTQMCKFWLRRKCEKATDCKFAHGEEQQRAACALVPCRHLREGCCKQGAACWFAHDSGSVQVQQLRVQITDEDKEIAALRKQLDLREQQRAMLVSHLDTTKEAGSDFETESTTASEDARGNSVDSRGNSVDSRRSVSSRKAVGKRDPLASRRAGLHEAMPQIPEKQQDLTLLCKFWLAGRCTKSTGCKFAHSEEQQRAACAQLPCRHFLQTGVCRMGDRCRYKHVASSAAAPLPLTALEGIAEGVDDSKSVASVSSSICTTFASEPRARRWSDMYSDDDDDLSVAGVW